MKLSSVFDRRWLSLAAVLPLLNSCNKAVFEEDGEAEEGEHLFVTDQGVTCGTERWSVKTGTDADIGQVNLTSVTTTTASSSTAAATT